MATKDFLPSSWTALAEWYRNFAFNLPGLAAKYGIDGAIKKSPPTSNRRPSMN